jgi:2-C-methyl-D-erythritol 4-phosphate cytidylyltransferase
VAEQIGAILVAAGASRRMGFVKHWVPLSGRLVLVYALEALAENPDIAQVALVVSPERLAEAESLATNISDKIRVCLGGAERRDSVAAGVRVLNECDWLVVHDAARPFVSEELIRRGIEAARSTGAAVAAIPAKDTMKRAVNGTVLGTLPRQELWTVQTPQVFRADLLRTALQRPERDVTDEATLIERMGGEVRIYLGSETNWKITTPFDLALAEAWLAHGRAVACG